MPFAEEFLINTAREMESKSIASDFMRAREIILQSMNLCAAVEPSINLRNVEIYVQGSYANKSNIYFPSNLEIIVEIPPSKLKNGTSAEFNPREFRKLFAKILYDLMGDRVSEEAKCLCLSGLEKIKHKVDITPCMTYYYDDSVHGSKGSSARKRGILLYDVVGERNVVAFPRLHAQNGFDKNHATEGNFKRVVRMFKTLNQLVVEEFSFLDEGIASGYFIECFLYNVPNQLFFDASLRDPETSSGAAQQSFHEIFLKVLNYLSNADYDRFVCQNEMWNLFATAQDLKPPKQSLHKQRKQKEPSTEERYISPDDYWQQDHANAFLSAIIRLYNAFPASRTFLA